MPHRIAILTALVVCLAAGRLLAQPPDPAPRPDVPSLRAPDAVAPADRTAALGVVGRRLALVVGTSDYTTTATWPRLPNAKLDAFALADELERRYGYTVTRLDQPDAATFKLALRQLSEDATQADDLLVFVAGHGHFDDVDNAGYLVFRDGERDCERGCYAFDNLKRSLFGSKARHILVMFDVCYGGTFDLRVAIGQGATDRSRSDPESLRRLLRDYAQYPSRLVFASVGKASTTDGRVGTHSPFMTSLLITLARPGQNGVVSLDRMFLAMQDNAETTKVQRPTAFEARTPHHPNGTFLFIEDIDFCDATETIVAATPEHFQSLKIDAMPPTDWVSSWSSAWVVPGTVQCRIWQWPSDGQSQLRCELGRFTPDAARDRADAMFQRLRSCLEAPSWQPSERQREPGSEQHHALQLTSDGRQVMVTTTCAEQTPAPSDPPTSSLANSEASRSGAQSCAVTLVFE